MILLTQGIYVEVYDKQVTIDSIATLSYFYTTLHCSTVDCIVVRGYV